MLFASQILQDLLPALLPDLFKRASVAADLWRRGSGALNLC